MAEAISAASPAFFHSSTSEPSPVTPAATTKRPQTHSAQRPPAAASASALTKRKQSKSRNGCSTCKSKRLKCDETKPICQQCTRRGVPCGGYKKDFKWRAFDDASFAPAPKMKKESPPPQVLTPLSCYQGSTRDEAVIKSESSTRTASPNTISEPRYSVPQTSAPANSSFQNVFVEYRPYASDGYAMSNPPSFISPPASLPLSDQFEPNSAASTYSMFNDTDRTITPRPAHVRTTAPSSIASGQSPRLVDLLLPGTDLHSPPPEYFQFRSQQSESFYEPGYYNPIGDPIDEDDVEEIPRHDFDMDSELWLMGQPSPTASTSSSSSSNSSRGQLLKEPQWPSNSPEQMLLRYDRHTCGILSVKDGPTENPWRTLVWPLARECPALYHAIASMTSFHHSMESSGMRLQGLEHMRTSIHALSLGIQHMDYDAAIATTLVLAFAESWDRHISSGIDHIKGAKILVNQALVRHQHVPFSGERLSRLNFLCKTWIYMDVIARLTSVDEDESNDVETVARLIGTSPGNSHLDPLMGSAGALFPLVGRVANLVRKVRKTDSNGPSIIAQAMELKAQLDNWVPPDDMESPEDPTTSIDDSQRTAQAYKYATLLYLHQAVPEVPSLSSTALAQKTFRELALVNTASRAVIVQIYPLTAAACEAVDEDDRKWVRDRWKAMASRMRLGTIDRCAEVVTEVWKRRDAYAASKVSQSRSRHSNSMSPTSPSLKRGFPCEDIAIDDPFSYMDLSSKRRAVGATGPFDTRRPVTVKVEREEVKPRTDADTEMLETEFTVRGKLHWLGVMQDWRWEVLLG